MAPPVGEQRLGMLRTSSEVRGVAACPQATWTLFHHNLPYRLRPERQWRLPPSHLLQPACPDVMNLPRRGGDASVPGGGTVTLGCRQGVIRKIFEVRRTNLCQPVVVVATRTIRVRRNNDYVSTPVENCAFVAGENVTPGGGDEPLSRRLLLCSCSLSAGV